MADRSNKLKRPS